MSNKPNPKNYKNESISPTNMLNQVFFIHNIYEDTYDGIPQLRVVITIENNGNRYDCYVSNSYVMEFLRDIRGTEWLKDPLMFFKSTPNQRHYEIKWIDDNPENNDLPF